MTKQVPDVLIVGAGLAGLLLGILLDRANIPYRIFERAPTVKPLGAVMSLNANILSVFEQLNLLDDLLKISRPILESDLLDANMDRIALIKVDGLKELVGYDYIVFARPLLYDLFLTKISKERLHFNKKIVSSTEDEDKVTIECEDGTSYHGDILVGSDGAYSRVRQSLYKRLEQKGQLPVVDSQEMNQGYVTMVGTTTALDPAKYPGLTDEDSHFYQIIGKGIPYSWSLFTVPDNKICWSVQLQLAAADKAECAQHKNAEWTPEANEKMIEAIYNFRTPYGILGDLIDKTPRELISKVFLEDKLFETWHHGRTVLIGDACHKLLPSAGQGAVNAMQDSVVLTNCLYELESVTVESIDAAFQSFRQQRFEPVKTQYLASKANAKIQYGQTWMDRLIRHVVFNYLPKSFQTTNIVKDSAYRPQVAFLPLIKSRGTCPVLPQAPSKRYLREQQALDVKAAAAVV
ncbi:hypothetical protein EDD11_002292 [Mortierella claussenii]|nr:hypothetical protein EDD11_002292 [Mortierella claussenii]